MANRILHIRDIGKEAAQDFGYWVRDRRKELGMSQAVLADIASLQRFEISLIENGHREQMTLMVVKRITEALNADIVYTPRD